MDAVLLNASEIHPSAQSTYEVAALAEELVERVCVLHALGSAVSAPVDMDGSLTESQADALARYAEEQAEMFGYYLEEDADRLDERTLRRWEALLDRAERVQAAAA